MLSTRACWARVAFLIWVVVKNYDPFLGTLNIRCRAIIRTQKGTIRIQRAAGLWGKPRQKARLNLETIRLWIGKLPRSRKASNKSWYA